MSSSVANLAILLLNLATFHTTLVFQKHLATNLALFKNLFGNLISGSNDKNAHISYLNYTKEKTKMPSSTHNNVN